ncbi:MAG: dihydroorotase [Acidimicrobiia bacterium]
MITIHNALILTPDGPVPGDLTVDGGRIAALATSNADTHIDARGGWVGPGLVDLHTHLREPGFEWKEDIRSGSRAGSVGGYTALVAMPNTNPAIDAGHLARFVTDRGREAGLLEVMPAGAITMGRGNQALAHLDELFAAGVRMFTDDGVGVADAGLLRHAMEYLAERGGVVAQHAEDPGLGREGHMHEGLVSSRLGIRGLPSLAEETMIARDLALVRLTGVRYHAQHVSSAGSVELIDAAKQAGLSVTAEVTPHHLNFDHSRVEGMEPCFKMYPPLRTAEDVAAVGAALAAGIIDVVATDHAPHADHECEVPFEEAPRGVIGLETAAAAVLTAIELSAIGFFQKMSVIPASIAGLASQGQWIEEGAPANLMVFDPEAVWVPERFASKSQNSPFRGIKLRGKVMATIFAGRITHQVSS